jgi:hypothetical protein
VSDLLDEVEAQIERRTEDIKELQRLLLRRERLHEKEFLASMKRRAKAKP